MNLSSNMTMAITSKERQVDVDFGFLSNNDGY